MIVKVTASPDITVPELVRTLVSARSYETIVTCASSALSPVLLSGVVVVIVTLLVAFDPPGPKTVPVIINEPVCHGASVAPVSSTVPLVILFPVPHRSMRETLLQVAEPSLP